MPCQAAFAVWLTSSAITTTAHTTLDRWMDIQDKLAMQYALENVSAPGTRPGSIIAATTRTPQDYRSHWVRDGANEADELITEVEESLAEITPNAEAADQTREAVSKLMEHFEFNRHIQSLNNKAGPAYRAGLGEVRFNPEGSTYDKDWGRPQKDGPALRARSMMRFYYLVEHGLPTIPWIPGFNSAKQSQILKQLYSPNNADHSVIKSDLEYIFENRNKPCIDLWEEIHGLHFYTLMTIRAGLFSGAQFAAIQNDPRASDYAAAAAQINLALDKHWLRDKKRIAPTRDHQVGARGKVSDLDISVLLAALHAELPGQSFDILDFRVIKSATDLLKEMSRLYPVNRRQFDFEGQILAPAVGRYPEDIYDGEGFSGGNPWFLATLAYPEWLARTAERSTTQPVIISAELIELMDFFDYKFTLGATIGRVQQEQLLDVAVRFFRRVRLHSDPRDIDRSDFSGRLSEQFDRNHGQMRGAENLTWSYAAYKSAYRAYHKALKAIKRS